jgi:solute carrier family 25 folate transporter 32
MNATLFSDVLSTIQYNQFLAGLSGGVVSSLILHPFDLIKIRFQVTETKSLVQNSSLPYRPHYTSLFDAFRTIYREKGLIRGLYQGVTPNVLGNGLSWGLYLFLYNTVDVINTKNYKRKTITFKDRIIYSTIAGITTMAITNPIWVVKTRMCLQYPDSKTNIHYKTMFDSIRKIYKLEGIKAFYKGLIPGIFGTIHGTIQFVSYEQMKDFYVKTFHTTQFSTPIILTFSALSKLIAASTTYPYQVVRTRLQDQHQQYNGVIDVIRKTYEREGIGGFYKGMVPALCRVVPACCITFVVYEFVLKELKG